MLEKSIINGNGQAVTLTYWCSICSAEPAEIEVEADIFNSGKYVPVWVGQECLTKAQNEGKLEE